MKSNILKKFFFTIILTLSLCNNGTANIIDLYCEFVKGKAKEKNENEDILITDYSVGNQYQQYLRGYKLKLNISKKKVIEAPQYNQENGWKTIFDEDEIWWYWSDLESDVMIHYILNRYTGRLREENRILTADQKNDTLIVNIYECSKAERLF